MGFVERKRTLLFALPVCFTKYIVTDEMITVRSGFLSVTEDDAYMYKVQDVRLKKSFLERIFSMGTVVCFTGDTTHPQLVLTHIKHASDIKEFIIRASEEARRKRRTMHTLDVDAQDIDAQDLDADTMEET